HCLPQAHAGRTMSGRDEEKVQAVPTATASSNADATEDEVPRRASRTSVPGGTTIVRDPIKPSRGATTPVEGNRAKRLRHAPLADAALPTEAAETN
ncbi:unnamed protein product, partial [Ectocarpus sp. 12 AP-2014]